MSGMAEATGRLKQKLAELLNRTDELTSLEIVEAFVETESTDEFRDDDDFTAMVCAKLRPRPYPGSGGIALTEPDDRFPIV